MNKYKIYCEIDGWVEVISSTEPTTCPNDVGHTVREDSLCITKIDVLLSEGVATQVTLDEYKAFKFREIDVRTGDLISQGFIYNTKLFSLSNNAQLNLLGVDIKRNDGILPITFNTIDDMDDVTFTTPEEVDTFFMTALASKKAHLDSGTALKLSVRNATTELEIDAIIDNR
jgi:hypothetical protein